MTEQFLVMAAGKQIKMTITNHKPLPSRRKQYAERGWVEQADGTMTLESIISAEEMENEDNFSMFMGSSNIEANKLTVENNLTMTDFDAESTTFEILEGK